MKQAGSLLMLAGIVTALFAFMMDTTVSSSGTLIAGSYIGGGSSYNLGLLQQQMMIFQGGLAAFLAGAFLYGAAERGASSERLPNGISPQRRWTDVREDETEEERDDRVGRVRRRELITLGAIVIGLLMLAVVLSWSASSPSSGGTNVDENLTTTDMNTLDENPTTTDMNAQ